MDLLSAATEVTSVTSWSDTFSSTEALEPMLLRFLLGDLLFLVGDLPLFFGDLDRFLSDNDLRSFFGDLDLSDDLDDLFDLFGLWHLLVAVSLARLFSATVAPSALRMEVSSVGAFEVALIRFRVGDLHFLDGDLPLFFGDLDLLDVDFRSFFGDLLRPEDLEDLFVLLGLWSPLLLAASSPRDALGAPLSRSTTGLVACSVLEDSELTRFVPDSSATLSWTLLLAACAVVSAFSLILLLEDSPRKTLSII